MTLRAAKCYNTQHVEPVRNGHNQLENLRGFSTFLHPGAPGYETKLASRFSPLHGKQPRAST